MVRNVGKQWISIVLLWHSKGKVETMSMGFNKNKVEWMLYEIKSPLCFWLLDSIGRFRGGALLLGHRYIIQC